MGTSSCLRLYTTHSPSAVAYSPVPSEMMEPLLFLAFTLAVAVSADAVNQYSQVNTTSGLYEANLVSILNDSVSVLEFNGIRYGEQPARFKRPVMASGRQGVQHSKPPNACPQIYAPLVDATTFANKSEDCLFLNVHVPMSRSTEPRAVMVFIHGGSFMTGYSYEYDGTLISQRGDVIVVTINYRLGPLGFLTDYGTGVNETIPANLGLWDQKLALEWVQRNIANFGGNPDRVTLFGESAGSASVNYHLMSPLSQNLFRSAILESGTVGSCWAFDPNPRDNFDKVCKIVNCTGNSHAECAACMRQLDSSVFIGLVGPPMEFPPVMDDSFVPETPREFLRKIQSDSLDPYRNYSLSNKSFILGYTSQESLLFWVLFRNEVSFNSTAYGEVGRYVDSPVITDRIHSAMEVFYGSKYNLNDSIQKELAGIRANSDFMFGAPTLAMARALSKLSKNTYTYLLDHPFSNRLWPSFPANVSLPPWAMTGSAHADELYFVFGSPFLNTLSFSYSQPSDFNSEDRYLSTAFISSWTSFAKSGNPNSNETLAYTWDKFNSTSRNTLVFNASFPLRKISGFMKQMDNFWNKEIPALIYENSSTQTSNSTIDQGNQDNVSASWNSYTCRCGAAIVNPVLGSSETQQMDKFIGNKVVKAASCAKAESTCYNYCHSEGVHLNYDVPGNGSYFEVRGIKKVSISTGWKLFGGPPTETSSKLGDFMCALYNLPLERSAGASLALKGDVAECPGSLKGVFVVYQNFCCNYIGSFLIGKFNRINC